MSDRYVIRHEDVPPSMNDKRSGYGSHWALRREAKQVWEDIVFARLVNAGMPRDTYEYIEVTAVLAFPKKRRRDEGNFRMCLEKATGDVLQAMGALPDDTPDHYRFNRVTFTEGPKSTTLTFECRRAVRPEQ